MTQTKPPAVSIHRFQDSAALSVLHTSETVYLTPEAARVMARGLYRLARSIEADSFGASAFGSVSVPANEKARGFPARARMKTRNGVFYFQTRKAAEGWAVKNHWPPGFIREYLTGFAVQACDSGRYAGPAVMVWPGPDWKAPEAPQTAPEAPQTAEAREVPAGAVWGPLSAMRAPGTVERFTAPEYWAPGLVNGDWGETDPEERKAAEAWAETLPGPIVSTDPAGFIWKHEAAEFWPFGACCALYSVIYQKEPKL